MVSARGELEQKWCITFLRDIPAIIDADMKAYCSFKVEDVASLPVKNIKILIKQGFAEEVEAN